MLPYVQEVLCTFVTREYKLKIGQYFSYIQYTHILFITEDGEEEDSVEVHCTGNSEVKIKGIVHRFYIEGRWNRL